MIAKKLQSEASSSLFNMVLYYLDLNEIGEGIEIFSKLQEIEITNRSKLITLRCQLADAMIKKQSNRVRNRIVAQSIMENIVEHNQGTAGLMVFAMLNLCSAPKLTVFAMLNL